MYQTVCHERWNSVEKYGGWIVVSEAKDDKFTNPISLNKIIFIYKWRHNKECKMIFSAGQTFGQLGRRVAHASQKGGGAEAPPRVPPTRKLFWLSEKLGLFFKEIKSIF